MKRAQRGFSLIEMMMVIAILGILMSMGIANYRRMQTNNEFNMEVERLAGELTSLPTEARALGVAPNTTGTGTSATNTTLNGRFRWKLVKNGAAIRQGYLGERQDVTLIFPQVMAYKAGVTQGVFLQVDQVVNNAATPKMMIIFQPDGTPMYYGDLVMRNRLVNKRIKVMSMGTIQGPMAE